MKEEHRIVEQVNAARKDRAAADSLIREYMPFIKSETARFMGRPPVEGEDDELSIAMLAFYEAAQGLHCKFGSAHVHYA